MLRITLVDTPQQVVLKLEGSLTGNWVMELEDCWRAASLSLGNRLLYLDLTSVHNVDEAGRYLLALLRDRGVRLIVSGLVMTAVVREIADEWRPR
jgi:ABC-type transporter Mla MlaB component